MAPNGELISNTFSRSVCFTPTMVKAQKPEEMSRGEGLQRAISDLSYQLSQQATEIVPSLDLPPISEVEDVKCDCCGMSEECTPEYISRVRDKYSGRWICGLCSEAVKEEMEKNGGKQKEALDTHMSMCVRFNRFGRTQPVLSQAEAMREMLRKSSRGPRAKSNSPRDYHKGIVKKAGIARSSSCIPAITKAIAEGSKAN